MVSYLGTLDTDSLRASSHGISSSPLKKSPTEDIQNIPSHQRQKLPERINCPIARGRQARRRSAHARSRWRALSWHSPGGPPQYVRASGPRRVRSLGCCELNDSVGQLGAQGPLGRWPEWAWRFCALGYLVGGGAKRPSSAYTVASPHYSQGRPRGRHDGSQVSDRKAGEVRVLSNVGFSPFLASAFLAPYLKMVFPHSQYPSFRRFQQFWWGQ